MDQDRKDLNIDDLLEDLHQLLEEEETPIPEADIPVPETPTEEKRSWTETQKLPKHVAKLQQNQQEAYAQWLKEQEAQLPPQEELPPEQPAEEKRLWTETQKLPKHVAKLQQNQQDAYAEWLREQGENPPPEPDHWDDEVPVEPKKKSHGLRNAILILLALIVALSAVIVFALPAQPMGDTAGHRTDVSTLLLAGLDPSGTRTDALILLTLDAGRHGIRMVSIPRDTLVSGDHDTPWINGVYGRNGGGRDGIAALLEQVQQVTGIRPDGYIVIGLPALEAVVDALGGVEFDVPIDMEYKDRAQDLIIDLSAGNQVLDGENALSLVRFRSGYADADLGRIKVQRDFLAALINTAASPGKLWNAPALYRIFRQHAQTDLTAANWLWLARTAMFANTRKVSSASLPGTGTYLAGQSYYVLDAELVAGTVNTYCNPYAEDIAVEDLNIRTK